MTGIVIYERWAPQIYSICINRVPKRNAIDRQMFSQLKQALTRFDSDDDARVAILSGSGGNFCAGYDLSELIGPNDRPNIENVKTMALPTERLLLTRKPIVACIEGYAAGLGFELVLRSHFRVADDTARMGFLNRRFDMPSMNGGTVILPKMIGMSRAMDLLVTGRALFPQEMLSYGLVNQICDTGTAMGKATTFAQSLLKFGNHSMLRDLDSLCDSLTPGQCTKTLLELERSNALHTLSSLERLGVARDFLKGLVCRHGKFGLHVLSQPDPTCTI